MLRVAVLAAAAASFARTRLVHTEQQTVVHNIVVHQKPNVVPQLRHKHGLDVGGQQERLRLCAKVLIL